MEKIRKFIQSIEAGEKPKLYRYDEKYGKFEVFEILGTDLSRVTNKITFLYKDEDEKDKILLSPFREDLTHMGSLFKYGQFLYFYTPTEAIRHAKLDLERREDVISFMNRELEKFKKGIQDFEEKQ